MRGDDGLGLTGHRVFKLIDIELPVTRPEIDQYRSRTNRGDVLEVRLEVVRREDDFVAISNLQSAEGKFDRCRAARTEFNMLNTVKLRQQSAKFFAMWTVIDSPTAVVQCPVQRVFVVLVTSRPNRWPLGEDRLTASNRRQVIGWGELVGGLRHGCQFLMRGDIDQPQVCHIAHESW